jgi:hypothetical protein
MWLKGRETHGHMATNGEVVYGIREEKMHLGKKQSAAFAQWWFEIEVLRTGKLLKNCMDGSTRMGLRNKMWGCWVAWNEETSPDH